MRVRARNTPRNVEVQVGPDLRRTYTLRASITRVGSHPDCDLRLSNAYAPLHLVSIECRGADVWLHNRSEQVIQVGDQEIANAAAGPWRLDEIARLNAWVSLRLLPTADEERALARQPNAAPGRTGEARRPTPREETERQRVERPDPASRGAASMVLSGILMVLLAWLVLGDDGTSTSRETAELGRIIQEAHGDTGDETPLAPLKAEISLQIQNARTAELRDAPERANRIYGEVRNVLLTLRSTADGFPGPWFDQAFAFVRGRLDGE